MSEKNPPQKKKFTSHKQVLFTETISFWVSLWETHLCKRKNRPSQKQVFVTKKVCHRNKFPSQKTFISQIQVSVVEPSLVLMLLLVNQTFFLIFSCCFWLRTFATIFIVNLLSFPNKITGQYLPARLQIFFYGNLLLWLFLVSPLIFFFSSQSCSKGFSGERKIFKKPEKRLNPSSVDTKIFWIPN